MTLPGKAKLSSQVLSKCVFNLSWNRHTSVRDLPPVFKELMVTSLLFVFSERIQSSMAARAQTIFPLFPQRYTTS